MTEHVMEYRAGLGGFGAVDDVPHWCCTCGHWCCTCGHWRINRDMRTGSPVETTARRKHRVHVKACAERALGDAVIRP